MSHMSHSSLISTWFNGAAKSSSDLRKSSSSDFGELSRAAPSAAALLPTPGQITLLTGPSGSGKSTFLRRLRRRCPIPITNIATISLPSSMVIDLFSHLTIEAALSHLSRVGLAEAHIYLATPRKLSDGQRWRLRLALALSWVTQSFSLDKGGSCATGGLPASALSHCLICDEFASLLDPVTAAVISRVLRNTITAQSNLCAILACSRDNLIRALAPDRIIRCNFASFELWNKKGKTYVQQSSVECLAANPKGCDHSSTHSRQPLLHPRAPHPRPRHPR